MFYIPWAADRKFDKAIEQRSTRWSSHIWWQIKSELRPLMDLAYRRARKATQ